MLKVLQLETICDNVKHPKFSFVTINYKLVHREKIYSSFSNCYNNYSPLGIYKH